MVCQLIVKLNFMELSTCIPRLKIDYCLKKDKLRSIGSTQNRSIQILFKLSFEAKMNEFFINQILAVSRRMYCTLYLTFKVFLVGVLSKNFKAWVILFRARY